MIKLKNFEEEGEGSTNVKGNPWPRSWQPKDQDLFYGSQCFENRKRSQSKLVIKAKSDFLAIRKYYNKDIKYICILNVGLPRSLQKRYRNVKELKVFSNTSIKCRFANLQKLTINLHAMSAEKNANLSEIIRANKHIKSLRVSNLDIFQVLLPSIKCLSSLHTFYIDINDHSLINVTKRLPKFLERNFKLKKIGAYIKDIWFDENKENEFHIQKVNKGFRKLFDSILDQKDLKTLKLDVSLQYLLEDGGVLVNYLLTKINQKKLEQFDIRIAVPNSLVLNNDIKNMINQIDYFAITTAGETVLSVFSDSAERLSLHKESRKLLMLNFEGQKKLNLKKYLECPSEKVKTLDLQFKGDNFADANNLKNTLNKLKEMKGLILYFDSCSLHLIQLLERFRVELDHLESVNHAAILFQNIIYDKEIYSGISKFLKSLKHSTYLNLMMYHNLRLNKSNMLAASKVEIDSICQTISSLPQLKTIKFAANPPWDNRPVLGFAPVLSSLSQLESLTVFLWLKTDARDENNILLSLPIPLATKLKDFTLSIYFKLENSFFDSLGEQLSHSKELESLTLSLAYYNRIDLNQFQLLLKKLGTLQKIKRIQLSLNVTAEERENKIERLQEAMRRGHHQPFDYLVAEMNRELKKERKDIKKEISKLFEESQSLQSITFIHAAKQYFSLAFKR